MFEIVLTGVTTAFLHSNLNPFIVSDSDMNEQETLLHSRIFWLFQYSWRDSSSRNLCLHSVNKITSLEHYSINILHPLNPPSLLSVSVETCGGGGAAEFDWNCGSLCSFILSVNREQDKSLFFPRIHQYSLFVSPSSSGHTIGNPILFVKH